MSKFNKTAFIVEGHREANILSRMLKLLPYKTILDVMLILPAEMNLYMLWNDVKDDDDIDIIEYLREKSESISKVLGEMNSDDFSETYLFFDLDAQQDNIKYSSKEELIEIIKSMLNTFSNETDKGKLYISYPMCEAYADYIVGTCKAVSGCCFQNPFDKDYKNRVGKNNDNAVLTHLNIEKVTDIINCYFDRVTCLCDVNEGFDYVKAKVISDFEIFDKQSKLLKKELIIVLSAFPKFVIDYYKIEVLKKIFPTAKMYYNKNCQDRVESIEFISKK